ncbi:2'-5'-oligoadenylate synthase 1 isoform X1 [Callorhinchus milii]|uniref:2'-5'-oligoadenylate synthase 1 isoform X1 n=2 Tax=Callorhinchus milii TaxID=7868 RepID=UPI001C3F9CF6|nr:2'-5'-oligoadenylate synthase 1 isoform X1 [Callorhinchus milii]
MQFNQINMFKLLPQISANNSMYQTGINSLMDQTTEKPLLYQTDANQLHNFIKKLKPSDFNIQVRNIVHKMCDFLKNQCLIKLKVIRVVKGGSFGKGTALKNSSDADLVAFLDCFDNYRDQRETRHEILEEIRQILINFGSSNTYETEDITVPRGNPSNPPRSISFTITSKKTLEKVEFDLLPAFDAVGQFGDNAYAKLIEIGDSDGEFSTCFTERQRLFVKNRPEQLKDLIRLVKYWYKMYVKPRKHDLPPGIRLPKKYAVELLTIHAWEQNGSPDKFSMAQGFRTVLELICRYRDLCIYWSHYYKLSNNKTLTDFVKQKLLATRPVILDPADPTGNVGESGGWDVMVSEASKCLQMPCVSKDQQWQVKPMTEIEITVQLMGGSLLPINANPFTKVATIKQNIQQFWYHFSPSPQSPPVPAHQQRLMFNNTILNDSETLLEFGILDNVPIALLVTSNDKMDIFQLF